MLKKRARHLSIRKRYLRLTSKEAVEARKRRESAIKLFILAENANSPEEAEELHRFSELYYLSFLQVATMDTNDFNIPRSIRLDKRIASFSESQCYNFFETKKDDLPRLLAGLRLDGQCILSNGCSMVGEEVLLRGLYELVSGESQFNIAENVFGRDQTIQSRAFSFFINHVYEYFVDLVTDNLQWWYDGGYLQNSCNAIRRKMLERSHIEFGEFFVAGFIDCNCLQTCRVGSGPCEEGPDALRWDEDYQRAFYNGWKSIHGLKHQTFDLAYGMTADLFGPCSLRRNDLRLLGRSNINGRLQNLSRLGAFGDSIYPRLSNIMTYWKTAHNTQRMILENQAYKSVRISIEWNYMVTANLYSYLAQFDKLKVMKGGVVSKIYTVATILRNCHVALYGSLTSNYFELEIPDRMLESYLRKPVAAVV